MPSVQEIESRLRTVEDKIAMLMEHVQMEVRSPIAGAPVRRMKLIEIYREVQQAKLMNKPFSNVRERKVLISEDDAAKAA